MGDVIASVPPSWPLLHHLSPGSGPLAPHPLASPSPRGSPDPLGQVESSSSCPSAAPLSPHAWCQGTTEAHPCWPSAGFSTSGRGSEARPQSLGTRQNLLAATCPEVPFVGLARPGLRDISRLSALPTPPGLLPLSRGLQIAQGNEPGAEFFRGKSQQLKPERPARLLCAQGHSEAPRQLSRGTWVGSCGPRSPPGDLAAWG